MSRPKPRASEPASSSRVPSVGIPPTARKSSQPAVNTQSAGAAPRFYDGPTVSTQGNDVKDKAKKAAAKTAAVTKTSTKKAVATARRHPWSIISILSTLPMLIFFSLASTVLCPPPGQSLSPLNKYVLSPLGYGPTQSHPVLCYPANVYHREILQPYVYPALDKAQDRFTASPYYVNYAKPTYDKADHTLRTLYNGPVKPVVNRIIRGAKRFYFTFVQPHIPYLKAKYHTLTAPYTSRISAFARPHLDTASQYANLATENAVKGYKFASTHPVTGQISKYAQKGYQVGSENGNKAYQWSKPHVLRARLEVERITREILGPRAVRAIQRATVEAAKVEAAVRAYLIRLYNTHLEPHVGPYVHQASKAVSPYTALFDKYVHQPYIKPALAQVFPAALVAETKSKSFLGMLAEFLPVGGGGGDIAERKGQMDDYYHNLENSRKPAEVEVPAAGKVAQPKKKAPENVESSVEKKERVEQKKIERAEMERVREAIKTRVEEQGKKSDKKVRAEVKSIHEEYISAQVPVVLQNIRAEVEREIDYILSGLDKLYTKSTSLTAQQVAKSSEQADLRLKRTTDKIKLRLDTQRTRINEQSKVVVDRQAGLVDKALGAEYEELAQQIKWIDGITTKDWDKYNDVKKVAESYKTKFASALDDPKLAKPFNEMKTELNDYHESFRERIGILKRTALDRIKAREAMASESSAEPSRVSILPIKEAAGAAAAAAGVGAGGVLGKGKEQVMSALSAAGAATPASAGIVDQAKASVESAVNAASSAAHDATRSVISAAGGTPSPESPREHAESVINLASEGIESFLDSATSNVHQATRSAMKAVGVTPTPESIPEHAESAYSAAAEAVESLSSVAESVVHDATRSAIKVVGGTPPPEPPAEYAESIYDAASQGVDSAISSVSEVVHQATRSAISAVGATPSPESFGESVESVLAAASEGLEGLIPDVNVNVHQATRSIVRAVGGTPTPENLGEHLESASAVASSVYSEATEAVSSYASDASSVIHDATRSAYSAVGGTPSPETPNEYLESIGNAVLGGAASVYAQAGDQVASASEAVHSGTRSLLKNVVGVTPSPETPGEFVESVYNEASSTISSVGSVVSDQASVLVEQLQEALESLVLPTSSTPEAEGVIAQATEYIASLASQGSSVGNEALQSGSSILSGLQSQLHTATRAASRAVGATPTPETPGEYFEAVKEKVERIRSPREIAESLVKKHASQIDRDLAEERARGTTRVIGDEHGHGHARQTRGAEKEHDHAHAAREEL
ncbi:uncharacterized protein I303_106251 [Kwoniella dejecticola CBS 10117]|uniref:Uncharacterized protein n=1 Tax=Kwoniella dejecticola CBS 10117 TaxID=1296121 RepID=A0A1A6A1P5_9TREE|nr:uncharacterized protein I303_06270 [Kwoniella dejecticola CBS 10117]OBR83983.1 hypothetical protein I303_06270 [Kwoniella dejecticola CBS 10117]